MDRVAWQATVHGVTRVGRNLATKERERERGVSFVLMIQLCVGSQMRAGRRENG